MFWGSCPCIYFERDADKASNADHTIHSFSTVFSHKIIEGDSDEF
jgi:hypothetical protein